MYFIIFAITFLFCSLFLRSVLRKIEIQDKNTKYILVTGCDSGFGLSLVKHLDSRGCHVFAGCFTERGKIMLMDSCSDNVCAISLDITSSESIDKAFEIIVNSLPVNIGLWALVNNAGVMQCLGPASWFQKDVYSNIYSVNVIGTVNMCNKFSTLIKKSKGRIINIASVLGQVTIPYNSLYCSSKAALISFSHALRQELLIHGVSVHLVIPGGHDTNLTNKNAIKRLTLDNWNNCDEEIRKDYDLNFVETIIDRGFLILNLTMSTSMDGVIKAYSNALFSKFPKRIYYVGWDVILYKIYDCIPYCISDLFVYAVVPFKGIFKRSP